MTSELTPCVLDAFHTMWDAYPEPVTLVHKSRKVVASNPAGVAYGREVGCTCSTLGSPADHAGCLANQALADGQPRCSRKIAGNLNMVVYWVPLPEYPEYFLHFSAGALLPMDNTIAVAKP